jgi:hypothetical protein
MNFRHISAPTRSRRLVAILAGTGIAIAGCGGSSTPSATNQGSSSAGISGSAQVLPVTTNPIKTTSTVHAIKFDSIQVENNLGSSGRPVSDHLQFTLSNTGTSTLTGFQVFYTVTDNVTKQSENYYKKLPSSFTIPPNGTRTVHFDNTGAPDHFPVNRFGLYATSHNPLTITVMVSANGVAAETATAHKAAGGAEITGQ